MLDNPFSIDTVLADCPWNTDNDLIMIAIQAKDISYEAAPANNLVFLIDVSGSMRSNEKLDNVKASLALLVENLREIDYVSIVTYASTAEVVLEPTSGDNKDAILEVLNGLSANGGTNGSGGIVGKVVDRFDPLDGKAGIKVSSVAELVSKLKNEAKVI